MRKILAWSILGCLLFGCDDEGKSPDPSGGDPDGGSGDGDGDGDGPGGGAPPTASAGADQSVPGGGLVTLDGSGSSDPDGDALRHRWRQRSGSPVGLSDPTAASPTFTAPGLTQQMTFELVVDDGTLSSAPDSVVISVQGFSGKRADVIGDPLSAAPILPANHPVDVELAENRLLIADEQDGVKLAELQDPLRPNVVGTFASPSRDVEVRWPYVFSLSTSGNLVVLDASDPSQPTEIAAVNGATNSFASFTGNAQVAVLSTSAGGVQVVDASQPGHHVLATLDEPGGVGMQMIGNRLYLTSQNGLRIYDLTNPWSPALVGGFNDDDGISLTRVVGNFAIGRGRMDTTDVVRLIDVSNPAAPTPRGYFAMDNTGADVTGTTLCASRWDLDSNPGIDIVDISNPDAPAIVGSVSTASYEHPRAESVRAQGNYCYVRMFLDVAIVDVSTPANPTLVGDVSSGSRDILVSGDYLYASVWQGLEVHDISNPASPSLITKLDLPGDTSQLTLAGTRLYITSDIVGAFVVDVSNPASPRLLHELSVPLEMTDIELRGDQLYGAFKTTFASVEGLHIYDVSDASKPSLLGAYRSGDAIGIEAPSGDDAMVYVHRYSSGVERVDVSDPGYPTASGLQTQWCTDRAMDVVDERVYCSSSSSFYALDFSVNPPANLGTTDLGWVSALRYASPYLFAGTESAWDGLFAVDPLDLAGPLAWAQRLEHDADPMALAIGPSHVYAALRSGGVSAHRFAAHLAADPLVELTFPMYPAADILAQDGRLYVATLNEAQVFDLREATPRLLASVSLPIFGYRQIVVSGGAIFVVDDQSLRAFDASLAPLAELEVERWHSMAASGDRLYLASATGLRQFDLSNPRAPTLRATYAPYTSGRLAAQGELVYVTDAAYQATIIDFSDAAAPSQVGSFAAGTLAMGSGFIAGVGMRGGLDLWDLTDPATPVVAGSRPFDDFGATALVVDGGTLAYFASHTEPASDVTLLDIGVLAQPVLLGRLSFLNRNVFDVALEGGRVWVLSQDDTGTQFLGAYSTMAGAVRVTPNVAGAVSPGTVVELDVSWEEHDADQREHVECAASFGTCSVSAVDATARTAKLSWTAPPTAGDYEVAVVVGHQRMSMVGRAWIAVGG